MYFWVSADNFEICQFRTFFLASRVSESLGLEKPEIRPEKQITSNKTGRSVRHRSGAVRNAVRNAVRTDYWTGPDPSRNSGTPEIGGARLGNTGIEKITKNYCRVEKRLECVTLAAKAKFYKDQNLVGFPNPLNLAV